MGRTDRGGRAATILGSLLLLSLTALPGCAEKAGAEGGGEPIPLAEGEGILAGIVVDAALRPLADAQVSATPPGGEPLRMATDANGSFAFVGLPAGTYAVEATKERHLSAHAIAQVTAGERGPLVQLVLEVQTDEIPFAIGIKWEGSIGCAFSYGNLCSVPAQAGSDVIGDQSAHLFWDEYVAEARVPDMVQAESVWEATLPSSEELEPIYGWSTPDQWKVFEYGGTFDGFSTPSPAFYRVPHDQMLEVGLGTDVGLVVEFYSGKPSGAPAGLTVNQPIKLFLHNFYGYEAPEAWRFVADGPPPPPT